MSAFQGQPIILSSDRWRDGNVLLLLPSVLIHSLHVFISLPVSSKRGNRGVRDRNHTHHNSICYTITLRHISRYLKLNLQTKPSEITLGVFSPKACVCEEMYATQNNTCPFFPIQPNLCLWQNRSDTENALMENCTRGSAIASRQGQPSSVWQALHRCTAEFLSKPVCFSPDKRSTDFCVGSRGIRSDDPPCYLQRQSSVCLV